MQSRLCVVVLLFCAASSITEANDSYPHNQLSKEQKGQKEFESHVACVNSRKSKISHDSIPTLPSEALPSANSIEVAAACIAANPYYAYGTSSSGIPETNDPMDKSTHTNQPTPTTTATSETAKIALRTGTASGAMKTVAGTHLNNTGHTPAISTTTPPTLSETSTLQPLSENIASTTSAWTPSSDNAATQPTGMLRAAGALAVGVVGLGMLG